MTSPVAPIGRPWQPAEVEVIPRVPWEQLRHEVSALWVPLDAPHHSVIGMNGSGKSFFTRHAILPMVQYDKVLIVDVKGDDPTLRGLGKPVKELPSHFNVEMLRRRRDKKPRDMWYRLTVSQDFAAARIQVQKALERVRHEGKWVVVIDETRYLTDPRIPSLGLRAQVEHLWIFGRSRENMVIAMTQAPKWVPSSFYDQASFAWIGRVNDEDAQKRLREIGGLNKRHLPVITGLKKREFLLCADGGDKLAITGIDPGLNRP